MTALDDAVAQLASRVGTSAACVAVTGTDRESERAAGVTAAARLGTAVVGHADDGRPLWPAGITGSIAHTDAHAVATTVATGGKTVAVGIDIERAGALDPADAALVLDDRERAAVAASARPAWTATLLWSVKESAFKAWSTATAGGLGTVDPADIHVDLDESACTCTARAQGALGTIVAGWTTAGGYADADGSIVTLVALRRLSRGSDASG